MNKLYPPFFISAHTFTLAAFASMGAVPAAHADDGTLATMTVTAPAAPPVQRSGSLATGLSGTVMETPFSVTAVPAETVRAQAGSSLQDALRNVPGVQADSGFNGSHTQFFSIRGAVASSGTGSNRVLRDGVRLSNYPYSQAFVDVVDVLRGPGAAVGVRSEPGGTVNIVTKQPQMENFGSVLMGRGGHGALETSVDLNRVLSQDREFAARIIATRSDSSEWRHVPDRLAGLKLGVAKNDGDRMHLRANLEATDQTYQPDYGVPAMDGRPVAVPLDRQFGEPFANSNSKNRILDLHGDIELAPHIRAAIDYTHLESRSTSVRNVLTGSPLAGQPPGTYSRSTAWEPGTNRRIDSLVASLTLRKTWGGAHHQFYADAGYYRENLNQPALIAPAAAATNINVYHPVYGTQAATAPVGAALGPTTRERLHSAAVSLQDQIDLGPWSLVAGARFTQQYFAYGMPGVQGVNEKRWNPKLAILYRWSDADTLYLNWATGMAPNQVSSSTNQSLASRLSRQVEAGWKSLWQDGRLETNVAVYQTDHRHMISSDQSTANLYDFTDSGTARSRGVEIAVTGQLTRAFTVSAAYAFTDARLLQNALLAGKVVPNVASHTLNLWGQYAWDARWKTGAGIYVQGRRYADEANSTVLPGYARVDITQAWSQPLASGESLEVQLAIRNLFDKDHYVSSHLHLARWITPGQGRNVYVTGTYRF